MPSTPSRPADPYGATWHSYLIVHHPQTPELPALSSTFNVSLSKSVENSNPHVSSMIPLVWFLLVTALLPVGFVSAKPEYGVGFELTLDYGYDQNTIPAEPLDRELTCPIVLQVFNSLMAPMWRSPRLKAIPPTSNECVQRTSRRTMLTLPPTPRPQWAGHHFATTCHFGSVVTITPMNPFRGCSSH